MTMAQLAAKHKPSKFTGLKHTKYYNMYPQLMERYRTKRFRMMEIGLDSGDGSLLWKEYFPCVELYGIEKVLAATETDGARAIHTFQGDQGDPAFLKDFIVKSGGHFDIIVDDGGHHPDQQITSYKELFMNALNPGGTYIIEDIETSYWNPDYQLKPYWPANYNRDVIGPRAAGNVINQFREVVNVVNKKFYDNKYKVMGDVDHWVKTITFAMNLVILQKKDVGDCRTEDFYIWPEVLPKDSPARTQGVQNEEPEGPPQIGYSSPLDEFCRNASRVGKRKRKLTAIDGSASFLSVRE